MSLRRRSSADPGHVHPQGNELEISYVFLPTFWGRGYAAEAARALLTATARLHPYDEPVLAVTQSSNTRSIDLIRRLGFIERDQFQQFDAQQILATAQLGAFRAKQPSERSS